MTSRKSSLSLAVPIEIPDECEDVSIVKDSHKTDINFIPSNADTTIGIDEISENDVQLRHTNDNDGHVKTVL